MEKQYERKSLQIDKMLGDKFHGFCATRGLKLKDVTEKLIIEFLQEHTHHETIHSQAS